LPYARPPGVECDSDITSLNKLKIGADILCDKLLFKGRAAAPMTDHIIELDRDFLSVRCDK
jgi:hypothetical protein